MQAKEGDREKKKETLAYKEQRLAAAAAAAAAEPQVRFVTALLSDPRIQRRENMLAVCGHWRRSCYMSPQSRRFSWMMMSVMWVRNKHISQAQAMFLITYH